MSGGAGKVREREGEAQAVEAGQPPLTFNEVTVGDISVVSTEPLTTVVRSIKQLQRMKKHQPVMQLFDMRRPPL